MVPDWRESTDPAPCRGGYADLVPRPRSSTTWLGVSYRSSSRNRHSSYQYSRRPGTERSGQAHTAPSILEEVIAGRFDYAEMSKRALAAEWAPLTEAQRTEFVELFKRFLSDRYAEKIEGYSGEQVLYLSERIEGTYAEVRTELRSDKTDIPMDYRLILLKEDRRHAYDIIVDGVSLVKNYRSQFQKIIRESSYQELVKKLRERTLTEKKEAEP